jgi:hypothetical protein
MVLRRIFRSKVEEMLGCWRKLHNEELHSLYSSLSIDRAGLAQSVYQLHTGWRTKGVGIRILVRTTFSLGHVAQIGSRAYPASYPVGTGGFFPSVKLTTHLQLVLRLRICGSVHPLPLASSWHSA